MALDSNHLMSTIPFPCDTYPEVVQLKREIQGKDILLDTRGDYLTVHSDFKVWYLVVHTGNIRGMVEDLTDEGFLS